MKGCNLCLVVIFILALTSCSDDDTQFAKGDYFPLKNLDWSYERSIGNALEFSDFGTLRLKSAGKVVADGKVYYRVTGLEGDIDFEVRREGSKYFERNAMFENNKEYKFLDTDKTPGESWSYLIADYQKIKYTVLSKKTLQEVNGTAYRNVITMKVDYYIPGDTGELELWVSAQHVYAEGVGEVYSFVPYPVSLVYGDVKSVRIIN